MRAWFLVLVAMTGAAQAADDVSFVNEGVVPAPIDEVWKVFATSEGYKAMGPALAEVDLVSEVDRVLRARVDAGIASRAHIQIDRIILLPFDLERAEVPADAQGLAVKGRG